MAKGTPFENGKCGENSSLTTCQIRWQRGFLKSGEFDENGERKFTKVLAKLLMRC